MVAREVLGDESCVGCTSEYREEVVLAGEIVYQEIVSCRRCWRDFEERLAGTEVSPASRLSRIRRFIVVWTSSDYEQRLNRILALSKFFHFKSLGDRLPPKITTFISVTQTGSLTRVRRVLVHPESSYLKDSPDDLDRYVFESVDVGNPCALFRWVQGMEAQKWFADYKATIDWYAVGEVWDAPPAPDYVPGSLSVKVVDVAVASAVPGDLRERFGDLHGGLVEQRAQMRVYEQLVEKFPGNIVPDTIRE